jgi:TatD DNase family protein
MYHDTHAHLDLLLQKLGYLPSYPEFNPETVSDEEIDGSNVEISAIDELLKYHEWIVQPSVSNQNFLLCHHLFQNVEKVYFLFGAHPDMVDANFSIEQYLSKQNTLLKGENVQHLIKQNRFVGIGEVGLDYFHVQDDTGQERQRDFFRTQIEQALTLDLPLVIHCRDAWHDLFDLLDEYPHIHGKFLVHCFTGGVDELSRVRERGGLVAFGGVTTFTSAKALHEAVKICEKDMFLLETDLPFLSPTPHRGEICKPEYIHLVAEHIAQRKGLNTSTVWALSKKNSERFFGLTK